VTEIYGYWQVMNSKLWERKTEKHEIQKLSCAGDWKLMRTGSAQRLSWFLTLQEVREMADDQSTRLWKSMWQI